jgi:hypothetical protein
MKFTSRLLAAIVGIAGAISTAAANPAYTDGDLLLGVRADSDPGGNKAYVLNIGPASQFTGAVAPFVVPNLGNIAADLATFTDPGVVEWNARPDVFWGIAGTDAAGDPANTLYVTRPRADVDTQTDPWTRRSNSAQSATNSTFRAFISGFTLSASNATSPNGTIQSTSDVNNYAQFTSGGSDFGYFDGVEGDFSNGAAGSVLDLYRLTPTTQNPAGPGLVFVGTFQFENAGALTFTPAAPTAPTFNLSAGSYSVNEDAGTVTIRVERGGLTTGADTVQFSTSDGSALAGTDYTARTGFTVNFAAGVTQVDVTVDITNRTGVQASRAFSVALSNPSVGTVGTPGTATVTINDTAPPPVPTFSLSASSYPVNEDAGPVTIRVIRSVATTGADTVQFSTSDGSAVAGTDYTARTGLTVNFAAGETQVDVTVDIANRAGVQASRTFDVALSNPSAGTVGTPGTATVTIADTSPVNSGQIAFSAAAYTFLPVSNQAVPNTLSITLNRTNGTDGAASVSVSIAAGGSLVNGTDFTNIASPTTVPFAAGEASKTFNIQLAAIADRKLPGTINLSLSNPQGGATLGATTTAAITVTAKDKAKPTLKLASKAGKVTVPTYAVLGSAKDNASVDRVEVKVNGGEVQLATLGALTNGSRSLDLSGIALENGRNTIVVTAFDTSGNAAKSATLRLTYANSRPALKGGYNGLLSAAAGPTNNTTGFVTVTVTPLGLFTGKVTIGQAVLPIKGIFDNAGVAHFNANAETAAAPTTLALSKKFGAVTTQFGNLTLAIAVGKVTGALKDGASAVIATIDADRAFFDGKTPETTVAARYLVNKGKYTTVLPARESQTGLTTAKFPQGDGVGKVTVTKKGLVKLVGTLADGTPVIGAAPLSSDYRWPFFVKLYKKLGVITGPVTFDDTQADSDLKGTDVIWIRPNDATGKAKYYGEGWPSGIFTDLLGAKYASVAGTSVVPGLGAADLVNGNADLQFFEGKLAASVAKTVSISSKNKVTNVPADRSFSLGLTPASGLFAGKFKHSDSTSPAFKGAIFQKGPNPGGYGFFLSTVPRNGPSGESGAVTLKAK